MPLQETQRKNQERESDYLSGNSNCGIPKAEDFVGESKFEGWVGEYAERSDDGPSVLELRSRPRPKKTQKLLSVSTATSETSTSQRTCNLPQLSSNARWISEKR